MAVMAELLDLLNAYTEELKGIYGSKLLKVSLYGSYARGDNRQWSDVNVFVLVNCSETELAQYREKLFATTVDFNMTYRMDIQEVDMCYAYYRKWRSVHPLLLNIGEEEVVIYQEGCGDDE